MLEVHSLRHERMWEAVATAGDRWLINPAVAWGQTASRIFVWGCH